MSVSRIATRYAKPLLELAETQGSLEAVKDDMVNFTEVCHSAKGFVLMLKSPIIPHLRKAEILKKIFGDKVNALTASFFDIVTRKNREEFLPEIAREFVILYNQKMGYQEATVVTTMKLDEAMRAEFENVVKEVTGKKPLLSEKVDPDLVGGYILRLGDTQIDESLSGKLKDLKLKFQKETI